jgi:translocation and assembly module TamB
MRLARWILALLLALLALAVVALAAAWTWAGRDGSAAWALRQAAQWVPGLQAEGVDGPLRGPLRIGRLAWSRDGLQVQASDVALAWQPQALLQRRLQVDWLAVGALRVQDDRPPDPAPARPPASLALAWPVSVDQLAVGRIEARGVVVQQLAAAWAWDGRRHRLQLRSLAVAGGSYRGEAELAGAAPFALQATVQGRVQAPVPGRAEAVALQLRARAQGALERIELQAALAGEPGAAVPAATTADARAVVTPWGPVPLPEADAQFEALDLAALWPQAPQTQLAGQARVRPREDGAWGIGAELRNGLPGPWDRGRLPVAQLQAEGEWRPGGLALVRMLDARLGGGRLQASGQWDGPQAWTVDGQLRGIDPSALHTAVASLPLSGKAQLRGEGAAIAFDADLAAAGPARTPAAAAGNELAALVGALELRAVRARGRWAGQALALPLLQVRTSDATLDGALDLAPASRSGGGRLALEAPGLRLRAVGSVARTRGGGTVRLQVADVATAQAWLRKLPGLPAQALGPVLAGRGELQADWQGGWEDPTVQATLELPQLQPPGATPPWALRSLRLVADGRLADARLDLRAGARFGAREAQLEATGRGGRQRDASWQGELASLAAQLRDPTLGQGPWRLALRRPAPLRWAAGQFTLGAGEATLAAPVQGAPAVLAWEPLRWREGELRTAGRLAGLPLAWAELLAGGALAGGAVAGDLLFDGRWDLLLGEQLRLSAELARRSGDLALQAEAADGTPARVQAGVREARLALEAQGEALRAELRWASERAGQATGRLATRLAREGGAWAWPEAAPLDGRLQAQLPRLGVWSLLAPPGWRLRGSVAADLAVAGTRAAPALTGTLQADDLALRSVVDGVALQDGRLRARLEGDRLVVQELLLRGAGPDGGSLVATGEGRWAGGGPRLQAQARLDRLRASVRSDRALTVSGQLAAALRPDLTELRGQLRVDRARIVLPDETAPKLSDDVVVRNLPPGVRWERAGNGPAPRAAPARPLQLAVELDFGPDFRLEGRGIRTRLAGTLQVGGESLAQPRLTGTLRTIGGIYKAYGQELDIDRGVLRFTGPPDNPALDIVAIRPRQVQKVGVQVTGTAQAPFVRLVAEPELPESEKLAWLVLGRPAASGGAEAALLQQAALALLESRRGPGSSKGPAALLGLDELGFRRDAAEGPAVTLGKRLGQNLYASYERGLTGTLGTLYVFYDLSRRMTVRAQAGERAALDLIFTFAYD